MDYFEKLVIADPVLASQLDLKLKSMKNISPGAMDIMVDETINGLSIEYNFGKAIALGFIKILPFNNPEFIKQYQDIINNYGFHGPSLGKILAQYSVPVILENDKDFLLYFLKVVDIMQKVGTYTLSSPLNAFCIVLESGDKLASQKILNLYEYVFSQKMTYNQCN